MDEVESQQLFNELAARAADLVTALQGERDRLRAHTVPAGTGPLSGNRVHSGRIAAHRPGPSLEILREWLTWMVNHEAGRGCFVVNTATELHTTDPAVRQRTEAAFEGARKTLASLLRRGIRDGDLPTTLDVDAAVESLFTTLLGLRVRERAGHDPQRLATAIDFTIKRSRRLRPDRHVATKAKAMRTKIS